MTEQETRCRGCDDPQHVAERVTLTSDLIARAEVGPHPIKRAAGFWPRCATCGSTIQVTTRTNAGTASHSPRAATRNR